MLIEVTGEYNIALSNGKSNLLNVVNRVQMAGFVSSSLVFSLSLLLFPVIQRGTGSKGGHHMRNKPSQKRGPFLRTTRPITGHN